MNLSDFLNSINQSKKNLMAEDENCQKLYVPYVTNIIFSNFSDTIFHANFMNKLSHLSKRMQYEYYLYAVSKKKRYSNSKKLDEDTKTIENICIYYNYSEKKAKEALNILSKEQIDHINNSINSSENIK